MIWELPGEQNRVLFSKKQGNSGILDLKMSCNNNQGKGKGKGSKGKRRRGARV